jgi:hypothetical protein
MAQEISCLGVQWHYALPFIQLEMSSDLEERRLGGIQWSDPSNGFHKRCKHSFSTCSLAVCLFVFFLLSLRFKHLLSSRYPVALNISGTIIFCPECSSLFCFAFLPALLSIQSVYAYTSLAFSFFIKIPSSKAWAVGLVVMLVILAFSAYIFGCFMAFGSHRRLGNYNIPCFYHTWAIWNIWDMMFGSKKKMKYRKGS